MSTGEVEPSDARVSWDYWPDIAKLANDHPRMFSGDDLFSPNLGDGKYSKQDYQ